MNSYIKQYFITPDRLKTRAFYRESRTKPIEGKILCVDRLMGVWVGVGLVASRVLKELVKRESDVLNGAGAFLFCDICTHLRIRTAQWKERKGRFSLQSVWSIKHGLRQVATNQTSWIWSLFKRLFRIDCVQLYLSLAIKMYWSFII